MIECSNKLLLLIGVAVERGGPMLSDEDHVIGTARSRRPDPHLQISVTY